MDLTIQHASDVEAQDDDIIVLGVASMETKGGDGQPIESMGNRVESGLSDA